MKKKSLLLKCLAVLLPLFAICIYSRVFFLFFIDSEAPYYIWNKQFTNTTHSETYDTIILGDSAANAAYIPEELSKQTVNLSLGGTTPIDSYYILSDWLNSNEAPRNIFISFQDEHLSAAECFWNRTLYTHRFSTIQNTEILVNAFRVQEPSIAKDRAFIDFIGYELYLPNIYMSALLNSHFIGRHDLNLSIMDEVSANHGRYIGVGVYDAYSSTGPVIYNEFNVGELFDDYYRKLLDLCESNDINVHIIRLPMADNVTFTSTYETELLLYYHSLCNDYSKATFDWSAKYYPQSYFTDYMHLNEAGAKYFCKYIKAVYTDCF